jgi:hypothetical protein
MNTGQLGERGYDSSVASLDYAAVDRPDRDAFARPLNWLLAGGILLRLAVFFTASPFNPDEHFAVIQYIVDHHALPVSNQLTQSYHPPLYYLLMAPIYAIWPDPKPLHFASFVLSSFNLILIWRLARNASLIPDAAARMVAFALTCFLPQFVMFGSFISNDTLTMLVGTLLFAAVIRYLSRPNAANVLSIAALVGVGLLTKGTFLLVGPALALVVLRVELRRSAGRALATTALFCLTFAALGCYKYVENAAHFGRPFINNQDAPDAAIRMPRGTWKGPETVYDIDVTKLIRRPIMQVHNTFSYPLLFYGTFWYPHIPESSYRGNVWGYAWVGSLIYTFAVVPTLIFLAGLARATVAISRFVRSPLVESAEGRHQAMLAASLLLLVSNLAVVVAAGVKYDAWSCFQSRLCFQSMVPAMVLFGCGAELIPRAKAARRAIYAICWATVACCVLYFIVEIAFALDWLPRGREVIP